MVVDPSSFLKEEHYAESTHGLEEGAVIQHSIQWELFKKKPSQQPRTTSHWGTAVSGSGGQGERG